MHLFLENYALDGSTNQLNDFNGSLIYFSFFVCVLILNMLNTLLEHRTCIYIYTFVIDSTSPTHATLATSLLNFII